MMMNFTWKQAETLSPGQLAIQGVELAAKTWGQFVKFVIVAALGLIGVLIVSGILAGLLKAVGSLIAFILIALFALAVGVGAVRLALAVVDGKKLTINEIFAWDSKIVGVAIVAAIVYAIAVTIGYIVLIVPGIMIAIGCSFTLFTIVDKKDIGPVQALKATWAMTNGDLLSIALLSSAISLIMAVCILPAYEIFFILGAFVVLLKSIHLDALIFIPGLLAIILAVAVICIVVLVCIGGCLSYAIAYRKLSQTRSGAMEAAMRS